MDEQLLAAIMSGLLQKGNQDMGEGDYKDTLANAMHARNHGGHDEELEMILRSLSPERRNAMLDYGGMKAIGSDPYVHAARTDLNGMLRNLK